jgi:osmotically-inducible protein OsmY
MKLEKKNIMKITTVYGILAFASVILTGCSSTSEGMKEDAEANGKKMSSEAGTLSENISGTGRDINAAMMLTPKITSAINDNQKAENDKNKIDVSSTEEKVILTGHVASEERKAKAEELALGILRDNNAKQTLENNLVVTP